MAAALRAATTGEGVYGRVRTARPCDAAAWIHGGYLAAPAQASALHPAWATGWPRALAGYASQAAWCGLWVAFQRPLPASIPTVSELPGASACRAAPNDSPARSSSTSTHTASALWSKWAAIAKCAARSMLDACAAPVALQLTPEHRSVGPSSAISCAVLMSRAVWRSMAWALVAQSSVVARKLRALVVTVALTRSLVPVSSVMTAWMYDTHDMTATPAINTQYTMQNLAHAFVEAFTASSCRRRAR